MRARRLPIVDEYVENGRAAVYSGTDVVVLLSELATVAWSVLTDDWTSAETLADELVAAFGEPEGKSHARALTESALRTLSGHGLVELDEDG
jgi:hypothetical protein